MDLGDLHVTFMDGIIKDLPGTLWACESTRQALFVCDGFSFTHEIPIALDAQGLRVDAPDLDDDDEDAPYHAPGDCALTSSEMTGGIDVDKATYLLTRALYFARFVDADKLFSEFEGTFFEDWPTKLVCPSHGNVIDNLQAVTPIIKQSHVNAHKIATAEKKPTIAAPR